MAPPGTVRWPSGGSQMMSLPSLAFHPRSWKCPWGFEWRGRCFSVLCGGSEPFQKNAASPIPFPNGRHPFCHPGLEVTGRTQSQGGTPLRQSTPGLPQAHLEVPPSILHPHPSPASPWCLPCESPTTCLGVSSVLGMGLHTSTRHGPT